jgi:hypothetical protein
MFVAAMRLVLPVSEFGRLVGCRSTVQRGSERSATA